MIINEAENTEKTVKE